MNYFSCGSHQRCRDVEITARCFRIILARVRSVGRPVSGCVARLGEGRFHIWAELFLGAGGEKPMGEMWVSVAA